MRKNDVRGKATRWPDNKAKPRLVEIEPKSLGLVRGGATLSVGNLLLSIGEGSTSLQGPSPSE
jgi:hypothetical protein